MDMSKIANLEYNIMELNRYFREDFETYRSQGIVIFDFYEAKSEEFVEDYIIPFRQSYVSDDDLNYEINNGINLRKDAIENKLPSLPHLKSGEFGEILMFFLARTFICPDANIAPVKWQWKEHRDAPCHLTDIMLLKCTNSIAPQPTDYVYSIEVKAGATPISPRSNKSKMNDAIKGAHKDKESRIGKMIAYLTTKYAKERNVEMAKLVKRFDDGTTVHFDRRISAAIIVERESIPYHIKNISEQSLAQAQKDEIALFAVPMNQLKRMYEQLYDIVPIKG